jgi:type IV secretion system protein TrbL
LAVVATAVVVVLVGPPVSVLPAWLAPLGTSAAEAQIPCPDIPGLEQACQVSTAVPNGAINVAGGVATAGLEAGARAVFDGMTQWVVAGAGELVGHLAGWIDESSRPEVGEGWFSESYRAMVKVGLVFVLPMLLLACIQCLVHQDLAGLGRTVAVHLPVACVGMVSATAVVDLLVSVTDSFSAFVGQSMGGDSERFGQGLTKGLVAINGIPGLGFAVFLIALVLALLTLVLWTELVLRQAAVLVTALFLPIGFAGLVWRPAARWFRRLAEVIFALILSKFVITAILAAGAAAVDSASEGFGQVIVGLAIISLAAFAPYAIFHFIPLGELGAIAALEGMRSRPARAVVSSPTAYVTTTMLRSRMNGTRGGGAARSTNGPSAPGGGGGGGAAGTAGGAGLLAGAAAADGARHTASRPVAAATSAAPSRNGASSSGGPTAGGTDRGGAGHRSRAEGADGQSGRQRPQRPPRPAEPR